jgi:hypothetical protein
LIPAGTEKPFRTSVSSQAQQFQGHEPNARTPRVGVERAEAALASDSFNAFIARQLRIKARVFVHTIGAVKHPTGVAEKFSFDGKNCRRVGWVAQEKDNAAAKK